MDFLDFENNDLYFDDPMSTDDEALLEKAACAYPSKKTETLLLELDARLTDNLAILVALYRFYYYQHRYQDGLAILSRALDISAGMLGLNVSWKDLTEFHLGKCVFVSMGLLRFYMMAMKASAYILLRTGEIEPACLKLKKIVELDPADQFGAAFLYRMARKKLSAKQAELNAIDNLVRY